jgi:dTDP-glucose 4,6-dehydratase/UDP-glucuronate decarboxylase
MRTLNELLTLDLDYICKKAKNELTQMSGKTVCFTGAAGFLGYYFCKAVNHWNENFSDNKIMLYALDNFMRDVPTWMDGLKSSHIIVEKYDVIEEPNQSIKNADYIIHAASIASPPFYRKNPIQTMDANIKGLRNILDHAVNAELEAILFFSSSEIYGDPPANEIPTKETFRGLVSCTGPRACYDESKRVGETLCVVFSQQHGVPTKIARPFNNYGPGLKLADGRALPDFVSNVLKGDDIVIFSDGSPTRTFCYVADAIVGYIKTLINGRNGESYNIGIDLEETSIATLAETVVAQAADLWGYKGKVVYGKSKESDYLTDNPDRRCPDITKARTELGYEPEIIVVDGVRRSLEWYYHNQ